MKPEWTPLQSKSYVYCKKNSITKATNTTAINKSCKTGQLLQGVNRTIFGNF
jgi:hypothetical protein